MKQLMKTKARKGFTLIELVIVVAIIGILALMIIPQFNNVTEEAKQKTVESNYQTIVSAYAMYQAGHNGDAPQAEADFAGYINGGFPADGNPTGATYDCVAGVVTVKYDADGDNAFTGKFDFSATYPEPIPTTPTTPTT